MKNSDGQIYCVGCESWVFPNSTRKHKFTELVSLKGKQKIKILHEHSDIAVKDQHTDLSHPYHPSYINMANNVKLVLEKKLVWLTNLLDKESDINKIKYYYLFFYFKFYRSLLECINLCSQSINQTKQI